MLYNNSAGGGAAGSGASGGGGGGLYTLSVQCPLAESIWDGGGKQSHLSHSLAVSTCWAPAATFSYSII